MKEDILRLRDEGKTYNEIKEILGCSKGTISYHCGKDQKEKTKKRTSKRRENSLIIKTDNFIYRNKKECIRKFQKREMGSINKEIKTTFTWYDVIEKHGETTFCYLSGVEIDLNSKDCHFDHIVPVSRGGSNDINNLGISHKIVNLMKSDLMVDELIDWCIKIVENNGYSVNKKLED